MSLISKHGGGLSVLIGERVLLLTRGLSPQHHLGDQVGTWTACGSPEAVPVQASSDCWASPRCQRPSQAPDGTTCWRRTCISQSEESHEPLLQTHLQNHGRHAHGAQQPGRDTWSGKDGQSVGPEPHACGFSGFGTGQEGWGPGPGAAASLSACDSGHATTM